MKIHAASLCPLPGLLILAALLAGCRGSGRTIYSPPARAFLTNAPAVRLILPADGSTFRAGADIRLQALATPHGTDLGPDKDAMMMIDRKPQEWELVQSPEDDYTVEFFAGTNRLGSQTAGEVSARVKEIPGHATPFVMPAIGYPAVELTWHDAPPGHYTLTAKVTNAGGLVTISDSVGVTVK